MAARRARVVLGWVGTQALWPNKRSRLVAIIDVSDAVAYLRGGERWCDRPPPFGLTVHFLANFALFCKLHFATEPYKIRVQRGD